MNTFQTASLTDMSTCQQSVIAMMHQGPVALLEEKHVAGVLISLEQWNAIAKTLVAAKECIAVFDANAGTR